MITARAPSHRVRICTVGPLSGQDRSASSTRASLSRCRALTLSRASSGTVRPVSATSAATAAVRSDVATLAWTGLRTARSWRRRSVSAGVGGRRLAVIAVGQAEEFGEGVVRVDAHAHRVGVGGSIGTAQGVAGAGVASGRVEEPCLGTRRVHELTGHDIDGADGLLGMLQVLAEEVPADPLGGDGEPAVGQMTDEVVNGVPCRPAGLRSWHAPKDTHSVITAEAGAPCSQGAKLPGDMWSGSVRIRIDSDRIGPARTSPLP